MNTKKEELIITPKTKVLNLIETYPQLEEVLIGIVPEFKKLKNPVLRKTVARIASLQQAAAIGNVKVEDLINTLRKEVGQDFYDSMVTAGYRSDKPEWFDEAKVHQSFDVRPMLEQGEHPVNQVIADYKQLPPQKIYKMTAPFLPAPLIDKLLSLGAQHYVEQSAGDTFVVYFFKES